MKLLKATLMCVFFLSLSLPALANPEVDRVFQLETLGWLKSSDNADGIFTEYLDDLYTQYFKKQNRFIVKKLTGVNPLLDSSSIQYSTLVRNPEILRKISQKFKVEDLIRTRIFKEADTYRFVIEWVYAPKGDILSTVEFRYIDPKKEFGLAKSELPASVERALDELISKLPFLAQVTGVEGDTVTVNMGRHQGLEPHQILEIATLKEVKRHPVLNTIEEWKWEPVARAKVEQVEESLAFAKVIEVEPGQNLIRFQKVKEIHQPLPEGKTEEAGAVAPKSEMPKIGWVAGNLGVGKYSLVYDPTASSDSPGKSSLLESLAVDSRVWLNSRWLAEGKLSESFFKIGGSTGGATMIRLASGYSFKPTKSVFDSTGWAHFGYKVTSISLTSSPTTQSVPSTFSDLFIGAGGEFPLYDKFTAQVSFDIGMFKSAAADDLGLGSPSSSSDISLTGGVTYHLQDQLFLRVLIEFNALGMDFQTGQSYSQKMFSLTPSVMYYF